MCSGVGIFELIASHVDLNQSYTKTVGATLQQLGPDMSSIITVNHDGMSCRPDFGLSQIPFPTCAFTCLTIETILALLFMFGV